MIPFFTIHHEHTIEVALLQRYEILFSIIGLTAHSQEDRLYKEQAMNYRIEEGKQERGRTRG